MSMLLRNFNRAFTVIRLQQFGRPRLASVASLELPRDSIFHYLPSAVTEIGPSQTLPIIDKAEKLVLVNHITKYPEDGMIGRPIALTMPIERDVIHYHRVNRKLRRMRDDNLVLKDPRTLVVENYCLLSKSYRYQPTLMSWYEQWHNVYTTFIDRLAEDTAKYNRQNYVILNVPDIIPSIVKMKRAETRRDNVALDEFRDPNTLMMLDLWTWLGVNKNKSMLSKLSAEQIKKVNFILVYKDRFLNLNLGELSFWRKDEDNTGMVKPDQMQRRLYVTATQIAVNGVEMVPATPNTVPEVTTEDTPVETPEIRAERDEDEVDEITAVINDAIGVKVLEPTELDIADIDASDLDSINNEIAEFENIKIDEDENFEVVVKQTEEIEEEDSEKPLTLEESVLKACDSFIEAGMLTTKEYQRITEQASNYRKIENPFGEGLLVDMLEVPKAALEVKEEVLFDDPTILDKTMLKTTNANMTKQYIEEVLPRDICSSVVSIQKAGVIVSDYNVEHVVDAANRLQVHTLKVTPVNGESATLRFTTPWLDEEGYWTANDITYTMRKQRVDFY